MIPSADAPQLDALEALRIEIDALDPVGLEARRLAIHKKANGDWKALDELDLHTMVLVATALRRRAGGPPKEAKVSSTSKRITKRVSADDLLSGF